MASVAEVRSTLDNFVKDLHSHVDAHKLENLLNGTDHLVTTDVGSKPESWTRKHLTRKLLEAVGLEYEDEIFGSGEGYPDFGITNLSVLVIGEDKPINNFQEAEDDIKEYLDSRAASRGAEYGIATDGIKWVVLRIDIGGDYLDYSKVVEIDFRGSLQKIAREKNYISQGGIVETDVDQIANIFFETFCVEKFKILLTQEYPRKISEQKKKTIKEFYNLYVELLFGASDQEFDYDTTLFKDIIEPEGVTEFEKKKFAIKLVNRLLFIKFLEDKAIIPRNFLSQRVNDYKRVKAEVGDLAGSLYKSQLEPIFFNLMNTPKNKRLSKYQGGWFDEIPYLNGSLFTPDSQEREYDVDDRILELVVKDLVEGHKLSKENGSAILDPSVLGHVFEMTINHMEEGENAQKKAGAYYTPSDVIRIVTKNTVDSKVYDVIVDVFTRKLIGPDQNEESARNMIMQYDLNVILKKIVDREGYFGDPAALREACNLIGNLKIVDPACGSGHFLTAVLSEIHRIRMELLRGLKGEKLDPSEVYKAKKETALRSIYGVDINPIAVEIAKLRLWLKMVEDGWKAEFGDLPNIDINIIPGNSLIGLPTRSEGQSMFGTYQLDFDAITTVRDQYKKGLINRLKLTQTIKKLNPELNGLFLESLYHFFDDSIEDAKRFDIIFNSHNNVASFTKNIKVKKKDNSQFTENEIMNLQDIGFKVHAKSARLDDNLIGRNIDNLKALLEIGFVISLERRPLKIDLDNLMEIPNLSYKPFHWVLEFPEAVSVVADKPVVKFDIIVGNPPYGDILKDVEKKFVKGYITSDVNDISAQFIERELQILDEKGYFGNVLTLRFVYQSNASSVRNLIRKKMSDTKIACFATRPSKIFDSSDPRIAITTGKRMDYDGAEEGFEIFTSNFIRISKANRAEKLKNIGYESTKDIVLGKRIGSGEDYSLPKVGNSIIRGILLKLGD